MASKYSQEESDIFVKVEIQIEKCFYLLEGQLAKRKDELLAKLKKMELAYIENLKSQEKTLKDLENIRLQINGIHLTQNLPSNLLQSSLAPIEKQISDLKTSLVQPPNIYFSCSTQILSDTLRKLGNIVSESNPIDYSSKNKAIHVINVGENVKHLHIDDYLYVACGPKVYVFNKTTWKRVDEFKVPLDNKHSYAVNNKESSILAITTKANWGICVIHTDSYKFEICQFSKLNRRGIREYKLINSQSKTGGSCSCLGGKANSLVISTEDDLFVTDSKNNRICVFDSNLFYRRQFGTEVLNGPTLIRIGGDKLIVRDNKKLLHLFNKSGHYLEYLADYGDFDRIPTNFCIDNSNNLILTDGKYVKIISPKAKLVKTIGLKEGEDVSGCGPFVLHGDKLIVACTSINCIKIF